MLKGTFLSQARGQVCLVRVKSLADRVTECHIQLTGRRSAVSTFWPRQQAASSLPEMVPPVARPMATFGRPSESHRQAKASALSTSYTSSKTMLSRSLVGACATRYIAMCFALSGSRRASRAIQDLPDLDVRPPTTAGRGNLAGIELASNRVVARMPAGLNFPNDRQNVGRKLTRLRLKGRAMRLALTDPPNE